VDEIVNDFATGILPNTMSGSKNITRVMVDDNPSAGAMVGLIIFGHTTEFHKYHPLSQGFGL
jgi:hypothetical protein